MRLTDEIICHNNVKNKTKDLVKTRKVSHFIEKLSVCFFSFDFFCHGGSNILL